MLRFIHSADWHILDTQYGKKFRGQDFMDAIDQVIDYAVKFQVDFIINSGDTLDKNRPSETMLNYLFKIHHRLKAAGIPMYSITGNHDASNPSFLELPGFQDREAGDTSPGGIVCIDNKVIEHGGLVIAGYPAIPWQLVHEDVARMEKKPDIVVWHGAIKEWQPFGVELEMEEVWKTEFQLAALLGDLHIHESVRDDRGRLVAYPGSVELTKNDHSKDKFFDVYEIPDHRVARLPNPIAVPIDTRPVLFLQCASEEQVSECVAKARQACEKSPDKLPMIFMRYNWAFRDVIPRILAVVDTTQTIFRYRLLTPTFGVAHYQSIHEEAPRLTRPQLTDVVDLMVAPTDPLNGLVRQLAMPDADVRTLITSMVGDRLKALGIDEKQPEPTP